MKRIVWILFCMLPAVAGWSQSSIGRVLQSIEQNNRELKANAQLTTAQKLEARIGNSLPDPTVEYEIVKGRTAEMGKEGELTVSQAFDFPTVYADRNRVAKLKAVSLDKQQRLFRRDLLLQAELLCLDLVALNRQQALLAGRKANIDRLLADYRRRLETGDVTILEVNKVELEWLNIQTEVRLNEADRQAKLRELTALNGDIPVAFSDTVYAPASVIPPYESLREQVLASNLELQVLESEQAVARKSVRLSRSEWLPKLELGYKHTNGSGEQFNGAVMGISIPLYENRHKVRQAKAQAIYTELKTESTAVQLDASLRGLYDQALAVKASLDEYDKRLNSRRNIALLDKALEGGELSTIDYFTELAGVTQSIQNYIRLENQYRKLLAELYKFRL